MTHCKTIVAVLTALLLTAPALSADTINVNPGESIRDAIIGADPGASKVTKAEEAGVPILDEAGFLALLETGELPA